MSDEQQPEAGKPVDEMEVIRLAKHLFREYAAEFNIDTEQMMKVKIKDFYNWYHETNQNVLLGTEQNIELREKLKLSEVAPILPYLFLVLILIFRPKGLLGTRET